MNKDRRYLIDAGLNLPSNPEARRRFLHLPEEEQWLEIWELDEHFASIDDSVWRSLKDAYEVLQSSPSTDLPPHSFWRLSKLRAFFAAHPNPPPPDKDQT